MSKKKFEKIQNNKICKKCGSLIFKEDKNSIFICSCGNIIKNEENIGFNIGDIIEIELIRKSKKGNPYCNYKGYKIFCKGAKEGQRVKAIIEKILREKKIILCKLKKVIKDYKKNYYIINEMEERGKIIEKIDSPYEKRGISFGGTNRNKGQVILPDERINKD